MKNACRVSGIVLLTIAVLPVLMSCSAEQQSPSEIVAERAQARWDALVEREFGEAWEHYTPGFRSTYPREEFNYDMKRRPIRWLEAEVVTVECADERCAARVSVKYDAPGAPSTQQGMQLRREVEEEWLNVDGDWWFVEP